MKKLIVKICLACVCTVGILLLFEGVLRIYNLSGKNYDIEMWKYGKYLKRRSQNPAVGFEHVPSKKCRLQNTDISINSAGFRDKEYAVPKPEGVYRIVVLGSSITFGWSVPEDQVYVSLVEKWLEGKTGKTKVEIVNTAVGNYNTVREIESFFEKGAVFAPDMVILTFFVNDPETLGINKSGYFLRNSQLAVLLWASYNQAIRRIGVKEDYATFYKRLYSDDNPGWRQCRQEMERLKGYCDNKGIEVLMVMIPEIHQLQNYPFKRIHEIMKEKAAEYKFPFLDFYDVLKNVNAPEIWAMRGDPHPNAKGHAIMAEYLYQYLLQHKPWEKKQ